MPCICWEGQSRQILGMYERTLENRRRAQIGTRGDLNWADDDVGNADGEKDKWWGQMGTLGSLHWEDNTSRELSTVWPENFHFSFYDIHHHYHQDLHPVTGELTLFILWHSLSSSSRSSPGDQRAFNFLFMTFTIIIIKIITRWPENLHFSFNYFHHHSHQDRHQVTRELSLFFYDFYQHQHDDAGDNDESRD